ncbi:MAG: TonB-dependent receptor [Bacteroidetes bacterium]|nr:MAG: TonB-dependent receptor [Bacteroidota bacterium]
MRFCLLLSLFFFGFAQAQADRIQGTVTDSLSGEPLMGVSLYIPSTQAGTITDIDGKFSLAVDSLPVMLRVSYLGYTTQVLEVNSGVSLNIRLSEAQTTLEEVSICAEKSWLNTTQSASTYQLQGNGWQALPGFAGEPDVVSVLISLPGVKKAGDGSGGMLVRGGGTDQNAVLLNGVPVFQSGHIISFYSPFQPELIEKATLYKGNAPANFGGRLSSVLDIESARPDSVIRTDLSLGLLLAKAYVRGPLSDKTSFSLAARRSGPDLIWPLFKQSFPAKFYDAQAALYHRFNSKNELAWQFFSTEDALKVGGSDIAKYKDTEKGLMPDMELQSKTQERHSSLRFTHTAGNWKFTQLVYALENKNSSALRWTGADLHINSSLQSVGLSGSATYAAKGRWNMDFGYQLAQYRLKLMQVKSEGELVDFIGQRDAEVHRYTESAVFAQAGYKLNSKTTLNGGLRLASYGKSLMLEPRLEMNHRIQDDWTLSAGIARNAQGIRKVSNASTALPFDIWYPAQGTVKVQEAWQAQVGTRKRVKRWVFEGEVYYKQLKGLSEYKEGSLVLQADRLANEMTSGKGWAYGFDFQTRYEGKGFQVWMNYSLSRSMRQFDVLNGGKSFFDRWDRRHDMNVGAQMNITKNWNLNMAFYYASGARYTPRVAQYLTPGVPDPGPIAIPVFGARNSQSLSAPHRFDVSLSYAVQRAKSTWELQLGAYNLYNSLQSFRTEVIERNGKLVFREVGMFGMMPSVAIKCKF